MKKIIATLGTLLLVGFISGCSSTSDDATTDGGNTSTTSESGVYTTTFDGAGAKTWYTEQATYNSVTANTANYIRNGDDITITIGARSGINLDQSDGSLMFYLNFASGVTTGLMSEDDVIYIDNASASTYLVMESLNIGTAFGVNIIEATDDGTVIHVKGDFTTTVYESPANTNPKTLTVAFEFDAHSI